MRRRLFLSTSIVALASCANGTGTAQPPILTAEKDALLVDQSFIRIANLIIATPGEPAMLVTLAHTLTDGSTKPLDLAQTALIALIAGNTPPPASVTDLPGALSLLDGVLAQLGPIASSVGPQASAALIAAEILLSTAETIAGRTPAPVSRTAARSGMTPDAARRSLQTFLAH